MPIVDIQIVADTGSASAEAQATGAVTDAAGLAALTQPLADALGGLWQAAPGSVWLRLALWPAAHYAENQSAPGEHGLPVFVTVLHRQLPPPDALAAEALAIAAQVAAVLGRPAERVHVAYQPPGAGRIAFGGRLVT